MIFQPRNWLACLLLPLLAGCANPGPPRPPSLNLAEKVNDLTAERVGNQVRLRWTTPSSTTDGLDIKGPFSAELCREIDPTQPHSTCTTFTRMPVKPGPSQATDLLPETLTDGPAALIAYRVQVLNSSDRSAGGSNTAFAAAGAAPPPVERLRATASRAGSTLEWQPQPAPTSWIELNRILLPTISSGPPPARSSSARTANPLAPSANLPTEVRLRTPHDAPDPGGLLDRTVTKSETYTYQAQRVRSVTLAGHTLELRSEPSPTITLHIADTFPPQPPTLLAAVSGGAADSDKKNATIDLSWQPVLDADLVGYIVYRRAASETAFQRLTPKPIVSPAFTDTTVTAGQRYIYRVTAIDTSGNESAPSNEAEETAGKS